MQYVQDDTGVACGVGGVLGFPHGRYESVPENIYRVCTEDRTGFEFF